MEVTSDRCGIFLKLHSKHVLLVIPMHPGVASVMLMRRQTCSHVVMACCWTKLVLVMIAYCGQMTLVVLLLLGIVQVMVMVVSR